jgi:hypothetical protein
MHDKRNRTGRGTLRALIATIVGVVGLALTVPAGAAIRGYTITSFDAIRVDAPVTVLLKTGTGTSARAEGDQNALDRLKVDVSGRLLIVTMERTRPGEKSGGTATLRLSTAMVDRIVLTGGGSISVDRMKGLQGQIVLGGNGDVSVAALDLDRIDLSLAGGGRVTLAGRAGIANIRVNGPGALAAQQLIARQASIGNEGPGSIALTADVTARVTASGSGDVMVTGKAACTVDNKGTGRVTCGGESF